VAESHVSKLMPASNQRANGCAANCSRAGAGRPAPSITSAGSRSAMFLPSGGRPAFPPTIHARGADSSEIEGVDVVAEVAEVVDAADIVQVGAGVPVAIDLAVVSSSAGFGSPEIVVRQPGLNWPGNARSCIETRLVMSLLDSQRGVIGVVVGTGSGRGQPDVQSIDVVPPQGGDSSRCAACRRRAITGSQSTEPRPAAR
jgi:hypothetical protein